ncbi:MAG: hypothetical protein JKY50_22560 [Oleispira sp.]|nr:hypothetical protein [Oleispira sp.]
MSDETEVVIVGGGHTSAVSALIVALNSSASFAVCEPTTFKIHNYHADLYEAPPALYCDRLNIPESNQASAHRSRSGKHKSKRKHDSPYGV